MKNLFKNTRALISFILKMEKFKLAIYVLAISFFLIMLLPIFNDILETSSNMMVLIDTMKNPAMISMVGPVYVGDTYTAGSMYANYMTVFTGIIFAIWNILFVNNHTRKNEETGRLELLRSLSLGKLSNISSTFLVAFITNLLVALIVSFGFYLVSPDQINLSSILNYTISTSAFGFLFAVITGFFAQISATSRTTSSLSFLILFLFYILRAIGDISSESLSLISPLGLICRTESFVNDYNWPIFIIIGETIFFLVLSYIFAINRDLNEGLIQEKKGRKNLSPLITGINTFTFTSLRSQIIIWSLVIFLFSAMYGSILGDLEGYINSSDMIKQMLEVNSEFSLTEQFVSLLMLIMSMISTIPALTFINRAISEEKNHLTEVLLTKPLSKFKYLGSFLIISILMAIVFQLLVGLGFWSVGRIYLEDIPSLSIFIIAALNYLPSILVLISLSTLLIGLLPNFTWLSYLYLGYSFLVVYMGRLLDFPEVLEKFTPYGIIPNYPLEDLDYKILSILIGVSILLSAIGLVSYRKRDLIN